MHFPSLPALVLSFFPLPPSPLIFAYSGRLTLSRHSALLQGGDVIILVFIFGLNCTELLLRMTRVVSYPESCDA